jgi:hypothetical protein
MHKHIMHALTVEEYQEQVLTVLSDGGFADKRTQLEAWCDALAAARRMAACLEKAYSMLSEEQKGLVRSAPATEAGRAALASTTPGTPTGTGEGTP